MGGVRRQVGDGDARTDHRGLVADDVDAVQQVGPGVGVADVELVGALGAVAEPWALSSIRSTRTTSSPAASSARPMAPPMKPAEPVSRTFTDPGPGTS